MPLPDVLVSEYQSLELVSNLQAKSLFPRDMRAFTITLASFIRGGLIYEPTYPIFSDKCPDTNLVADLKPVVLGYDAVNITNSDVGTKAFLHLRDSRPESGRQRWRSKVSLSYGCDGGSLHFSLTALS